MNEDAWLPDYPIVSAKYWGDPQEVVDIDTIVLHRFSSGVGRDIGLKYVQNPTQVKGGRTAPRLVSWHFTVFNPVGEEDLPVYAHVPLNFEAWHARGYNSNSLGIEHQGPAKGDWSPETVQWTQWLIEQLIGACPGIRRVVSHKFLDPGRKIDPHGFPWDELQYIQDLYGVELYP